MYICTVYLYVCVGMYICVCMQHICVCIFMYVDPTMPTASLPTTTAHGNVARQSADF